MSFISYFDVRRRGVYGTRARAVSANVKAAKDARQELRVRFKPFAGARADRSRVGLLVRIFVVFVECADRVAARVVLVGQVGVHATRDCVITNTTVEILAFHGNGASIVAVATNSAFRRQGDGCSVVIINDLPIAFVRPRIFGALEGIVFTFLSCLSRVDSNGFVVVLGIVTAFRMACIDRVLFINAGDPAATVGDRLSSGHLTVFT